MKKLCAFFLGSILFYFSFSSPLWAKPPQGYLFIIGGGERPESMMKRFIGLAQGFQSGKILIFPMASSVPDEVGPEQVSQLRNYGAQNVEYRILSREQALDPENVKWLDEIGGVFFSGGVQSRLAEVLIGTPILERLQELYRQGATIGGTSAGAAVLSEIMITGDEQREAGDEESFTTIQAKNIVTAQGFAFIKSAIIDQHFVARKRHNRLISLIAENPELLGIGIDESTAVIVLPDQTLEVIGQNNVIIYDASKARIEILLDQSLSAQNIMMHVLKPGDKFDLKAKTASR